MHRRLSPGPKVRMVARRSSAALVLLVALASGPGCSSGGGSKGGPGGVAGVGGVGGDTTGAGGGGAGGGGAAGSNPAPAADIVIVLDRSGSMNDGVDGTTCTGGCGASSKWTLLEGELGRVLSATDTTVRWGLKLFASNNACDVAAGVDVAPQLASAAAIIGKLALVSAASSTPTTAAVTTTAAYLTALADGAPKYMVLITDGAPNCGSGPCAPAPGETMYQCDDANAIAAVKQAFVQLGIPTFVLGVGVGSDPGGTLTQLALEGGAPRATDPFYYPVQSAADLSAAFSAIVTLTAP